MIASQLFLMKISDMPLSFRCNERLTNQIKGGSRPIRSALPNELLQKHATILAKYNLVYQEQYITADGTSLCPWPQFRKRPFALHNKTQTPPAFYQALRALLTTMEPSSFSTNAVYDYDTA